MSQVLRIRERKLFLFPGLLQAELGRLPCAIVWYTVSKAVHSKNTEQITGYS